MTETIHKKEEEIRNYNPFGKGGGGAPLRKYDGKVYFAEYAGTPALDPRKPSRGRAPKNMAVEGRSTHQSPNRHHTMESSNLGREDFQGRTGNDNTHQKYPIVEEEIRHANGTPQPLGTNPVVQPQPQLQSQLQPQTQPQPTAIAYPQQLERMERQFQEFRSELKHYKDISVMKAFEPLHGLGEAIRSLRHQIPAQQNSAPANVHEPRLANDIKLLEGQMKQLFEEMRRAQKQEVSQQQREADKRTKDEENQYQQKMKHLENLVEQVAKAAERIKEERQEREQEAKQRSEARVDSDHLPSLPPQEVSRVPFNNNKEKTIDLYGQGRKKIRIYKNISPYKKPRADHRIDTDLDFLEQKNKQRLEYWAFMAENMNHPSKFSTLQEQFSQLKHSQSAWKPTDSEEELAGETSWEYI